MEEGKRKIPEEGPHGVDRFTSNGYGIEIGGKKVVPIDQEEDEIEEVDETEE